MEGSTPSQKKLPIVKNTYPQYFKASRSYIIFYKEKGCLWVLNLQGKLMEPIPEKKISFILATFYDILGTNKTVETNIHVQLWLKVT